MSASSIFIGIETASKPIILPHTITQEMHNNINRTFTTAYIKKTPIVTKLDAEMLPEVRHILAQKPRDFYVDACELLKKVTSTPHRMSVTMGLLNCFIVQSLLLYKLKNDNKIISYIADMDNYWKQFHNKIKDLPVTEDEHELGYTDENWYRQALANQIGLDSPQAAKAFEVMGWGDFYSYIIADDTKDVAYVMERN